MLGDYEVTATLPVKDINEAKEFYESVLGLKLDSEDKGGLSYRSLGGSCVYVYESEFAGTNEATAAAWNVDDVPDLVEKLKAKGVDFEVYENLPDVTVEGDIHVMGDLKAAWFKDPSGNILSIVSGM